MPEETQQPQASQAGPEPAEAPQQDAQAPDAQTPDAQAPDAQAPDAQAPDAQAPEGQGQPVQDSETQKQEEPSLPETQVSVEDAGTLKKKVTVTVPRGRIQAKMDEMFGELSRTALVPGFRIGHAPRRLIEKRFGRDVSHDVRNALVGESLEEAVKKAQLKTLGEPDLDLEKIDLPEQGDMKYSFEIEVAPQFDLPDLKGIAVGKPILAITEERVDEVVEEWRRRLAAYEVTDQPASEGDLITADARISGEGIETYESKDHGLRVAPGQVEGLPLVDLGRELLGKKVGDTARLSVKVPQAHPTEAWRGKELTVELTLTEVQARKLPEIDEKFARSYGVETPAQLRDHIKSGLETRLEREVQQAMRNQVSQYLLENTKFELPPGLVERHTTSVLQHRYVELVYQGVPREQIDEHLTELQTAASEEARRDMKLAFILDKIAENEKIEASEEEVNARVALMARQSNRRPERLRQELAADGTLSAVETTLIEEKALDKLLSEAWITKTPVQESAEEAAENPPAEAAENPPAEAAENPPAEAAENPPAEAAENPPAEAAENPPAEAAENPPAEAAPDRPVEQ